jgi:methyltransferase family protein
MPVNAQYNVASPDGLANRITLFQRRKMFAKFLALTRIDVRDTILDVGVTSDRTCDHSNYLEAWYPHKARITAAGTDDVSFLSTLYPGAVVRADGRRLPFADGTFDFVHSSAVVEHVGSRENQTLFVRELWRIARKGIFLTTPNRWFPVEFHTSLPLLHWLPPPLFRRIPAVLEQRFFADEGNLNLLSQRSLAAIAETAGMPDCELRSVSLFGVPTNLLLVARKQQPAKGVTSAA